MPLALVTGGAGYIGSHTTLALLQAGWGVVVVDNMSNSSSLAVERARELAGDGAPPLSLAIVDLRDRRALRGIFDEHRFDAVVHFAGLKAVAESVVRPLDYYDHNVGGTLQLVRAMTEAGVRRLVFSSSATVYGDPERVPLDEEAATHPANPYGRTKLFIEELLRDVAAADDEWRIALLRYFNPVGAHPSGRIGEDPVGVPNNLMPFCMQVASGRRSHLTIFGDDYPTTDGTCIRDYIHVMDLAEGHVAALDALPRLDACTTVNLGTGRGTSVLEMVEAVGRAIGKAALPYEIGPRRPGDVAAMWADSSRARELLGWHAHRGLEEMCADHWRWQRENPDGYGVTAGGAEQR